MVEFEQNEMNITSEQASGQTQDEDQTKETAINDKKESSIPTMKFLSKNKIQPQKLPPIKKTEKIKPISKNKQSGNE